jgi:hypothetical protein
LKVTAYGSPYQISSILYVQRFDAGGHPLCPEKQILATEPRYQIGNLEYAADGQGGLILIWRFQKELVAYGGIFAQRVDAEGNIQWGEEGIAVFNEPDCIRAMLPYSVMGQAASWLLPLPVIMLWVEIWSAPSTWMPAGTVSGITASG